jgi:hypothetical protein
MVDGRLFAVLPGSGDPGAFLNPGIRDLVPFLPLDPGSGAFLTSGSGIRCLFDLWIRDPGWVKNQNPESGALLTPGDLG